MGSFSVEESGEVGLVIQGRGRGGGFLRFRPLMTWLRISRRFESTEVVVGVVMMKGLGMVNYLEKKKSAKEKGDAKRRLRS